MTFTSEGLRELKEEVQMAFTSERLRVLEETMKKFESQYISDSTNVPSFEYGMALKAQSRHYHSIGDLPKARELNAKACELFYLEKDKDRFRESTYTWCLYSEAEMANMSGDFSAAKNALDKVQASTNSPMLSEIERMYRLARYHSLRAIVYRDMGDILQGLDEAIKANELLVNVIDEY